MSMSDPIADMLTRMRNAQRARKKRVTVPFSTMKESIAKVLQAEGYIDGFSIETRRGAWQAPAEGQIDAPPAETPNKDDRRGARRTPAEGAFKQLVIKLRYHDEKPAILSLKRVSRPGLRVYRGVKDLPVAMSGFATVVVSTSKGVVSDRKARELGQGGEVVCIVE